MRMPELSSEILEKHDMSQENDFQEVPFVMDRLGQVLMNQGKYAEAEVVWRETVLVRKNLPDQRVLGGSLRALGIVLLRQETGGAEPVFREALAFHRKVLGNEHPGTAESLRDLASVLRDRGGLIEAETLQREE